MFRFAPMDCLFTSAGLPLFLLDIVLDVWAAVDLYQEGAYLCLGVLLVLLIGSSVLAQLYSWLWYKYDKFEVHTKVEDKAKTWLGTLHLFQLGIYIRHAAVLESSPSLCRCCRGTCGYSEDGEDPGVYLNHDLSMLRLFETFSESAPQIVLMLSIIMRTGKPDPITVLKMLGSLSAVAFCVTTHHRCLRSFLPEKKNQKPVSSIVYFLWNLLLLSSRIVALALFASVEPCFIFTHFFCSWLVFFFFAWRSNTDFMETPAGEWLYRATLGLIWYFNWFNAVDGKTRNQSVAYHACMLLDVSVLCGVWYWRMSSDPPHHELSCLQAAIIASAVVAVYVLGLVCRIIYYLFFHPKLYKQDLTGNEPHADQVDFGPGAPVQNGGVTFRSLQSGPSQPAPCNKRMEKLAENFYSRSSDDVVV
ncbi:XK-related protein 8 [Fundulus heteroclitus]|uniref:XK-related protein 8 n=1 Tax=Fundulus heteroclitus TaxID=8078 RepID=UPI00165BC923|nr:XK-related protein 8 [Fundulus heteroclitus]